MMRHLDEGTLQALVDGELTDREEAEAGRHLEMCRQCAEALAEVRGSVALLRSALSLLDPAPHGTIQKVSAVSAVDPPVTIPSRGPSRRWIPLGRAAALLLTCAAAASATIPGSPVREWFGARLAPSTSPLSTETSASTVSEVDRIEPGVSVAPQDGRIRFVLSNPSSNLQIRAILTDAPHGGVFATDEASDAYFRTSAGTIEVVGATEGELRVEIPRQAISAVVEIDGSVYLMKEGDQLRLIGPAPEAAASEIVFGVDR